MLQFTFDNNSAKCFNQEEIPHILVVNWSINVQVLYVVNVSCIYKYYMVCISGWQAASGNIVQHRLLMQQANSSTHEEAFSFAVIILDILITARLQENVIQCMWSFLPSFTV